MKMAGGLDHRPFSVSKYVISLKQKEETKEEAGNKTANSTLGKVI